MSREKKGESAPKDHGRGNQRLIEQVRNMKRRKRPQRVKNSRRERGNGKMHRIKGERGYPQRTEVLCPRGRWMEDNAPFQMLENSCPGGSGKGWICLKKSKASDKERVGETKWDLGNKSRMVIKPQKVRLKTLPRKSIGLECQRPRLDFHKS